MRASPDPPAGRGVLTLGETMGVAVTAPGTPMLLARTARLHTAGAESTVAIGLCRLGVAATWVGVVGDDAMGERIRRDLRAEGVDVRFVRVETDAPTGFMLRELRTAERARVTYYRQGSAGSQLSAADVDAAFDAVEPELVHVTGITPALSAGAADAVHRVVQRARASGAAVSLDVNHRATLPGRDTAARVVGDLLADVDVLFVGADELHVLTPTVDVPAAAAEIARRGPAEVVVKQGAAGAFTLTGGLVERVAGRRVEVRDVVGAGDSFVAGYLAARLLGHGVTDRLRWATRCAAATVGSDGDWEGLPTRSELERPESPPAADR